jgi:hypothetical protein
MRNDSYQQAVTIALLVVLAMPARPARAQQQGGDSHGHGSQGHDNHGHENQGHDYHGSDFHGRDFHHFTPYERQTWSGGHWEHGWHDNRFAWWWAAGGGWYSYPAPIYPFPTYVPPAVVVQQPPQVPTLLPPSQFWYHCDNPPGYYPYVAVCNGPWREMAAGPPQ